MWRDLAGSIGLVGGFWRDLAVTPFRISLYPRAFGGFFEEISFRGRKPSHQSAIANLREERTTPSSRTLRYARREWCAFNIVSLFYRVPTTPRAFTIADDVSNAPPIQVAHTPIRGTDTERLPPRRAIVSTARILSQGRSVDKCTKFSKSPNLSWEL